MSQDWFGVKSQSAPHFRVGLSDDRFVFDFKVSESAYYSREHQSGDFVEGLWEQDVCEFFVGGPGSDYIEFNIGPQGAWWAASFSDYRQRVGALKLETITVENRTDENSWAVNFTVPLSELAPWHSLCLGEYRLAVTFISHHSGVNYHCYGHTSGGEPDFHLKENRLPLLV